MQGLLNRMVATVRYNYIPPEKGSRAIHGAAAMLGLQLAGDLPETAILVSGMRHKAEKKDLIEAFKVFGEIEDAAVAPNFRGFGKEGSMDLVYCFLLFFFFSHSVLVGVVIYLSFHLL